VPMPAAKAIPQATVSAIRDGMSDCNFMEMVPFLT
jgi:hypothetical protein